MKSCVAALLLCVFAGSVLADGKKLVLPSGNELNTYLKENPEMGCARCGSVVSVTVLSGQHVSKKATGATMPAPTSNVAPQMLPVGGEKARAQRQKMREAPADSYRVVVHNDDGTNASYDLSDVADFAKGDRVQFVDGKLIRK